MSADSEAALDPRPSHVDPISLGAIAALLTVDADDGGERVTVTGVSLGSRDVRHGDLYAALPGASTHGARFAREAVEAGAHAIVTDPYGASILGEPADVPVLVVADPRSRLGEVSATVYGHPSDAITTIGITGTQGKTTSTYLAESALRAAGARAAVVGTMGTRIDGHPVASALTTPEAPQLHALFALMVERDVTDCAMEVSSHALVKGRVDGVVFGIAVFLNLGRDHLDFHRDMDDYFDAKAMLFAPEHARQAVINIDDEYGRRLVGRTPLPTLTFSTNGNPADWHTQAVSSDALGSAVLLEGPDGQGVDLQVPLPGAFNVSNAVGVAVALVAAGHDLVAVAAGIAACPGVPGRMERVDEGQDYTAIVDYAHKPDALKAVLDSLRPIAAGRLIIVIGAGGDRDAGKRPLMGAIAAQLSDVVIVTDDNPRSEDPAAIRAELLAGARAAEDADATLLEIGDRHDAIGHAVALASQGDVVLVAGKGHERGQNVAGVVHVFDDREVLRSAIEGDVA